MNLKNILIVVSLIFVTAFISGCESPQQASKIEKPREVNAPIGAVAEIYQTGAMEVRGFGIVAGLSGTGSSECDPVLKHQLVKYIQVQMVDRQAIDPEEFIASKNTAVVEVYGVIPPIASKGDVFDLRVAPLRNTQTTSLEGGRLYTTKLVGHDTIFKYDQYSKTLAYAAGPIFIDKDEKNYDLKKGYIFAGGEVAEQVQITAILREPNYYTASRIRNLLNERFGTDTASAKSPVEIRINIPDKYKNDKNRFLDMVRMLYLGSNFAAQQQRIDNFINDMSASEDKLTPEIGLEAIGSAALDELSDLLSHPDELVRLHAARCMLNIGSDSSIEVLRAIIRNPDSPHRIEAIKAVGFSARQKDALPILSMAASDKDFDIAYAAYEQLRSMGDISVSSRLVSGDFMVDTVITKGPKRIFISRQSVPRVVIFGDPVSCDRNLFVQASDGEIILNAAENDKYISISRKNPSDHGMIGPLYSSFKVKDVVRTMGERPQVPRNSLLRPGLAIPYDDIVEILEKMCVKGLIDAQFVKGPIAEFPELQKRIERLQKQRKEPQTGTASRAVPKVKEKKKLQENNTRLRKWEELLDAENPQMQS